MKVLAIEKELPGTKSDDFKPHLKAEALEAWNLYQNGIIREMYFREDQDIAVLILECKDVTEAQDVLSSLLLVKEGLIDFDIIPLKPYPGFSRLFSDEV